MPNRSSFKKSESGETRWSAVILRVNPRVLAVAAVFFAVVSILRGQNLIIPQIADGNGWQTTLVIGNTSSYATSAILTFFQDAPGGTGATQPWSPPFQEGGGVQNLALPAGGTVFLHTTATAGTTTAGWAQIQSTPGVVAYAIFTQRGGGRPDQDGTSPAAASGTHVLMPFDNTGAFVTTFAIVNNTTSSETISVGIQPTSGASFQPDPINLPAKGHLAARVQDQFQGTAGQSGMLEFYSGGGSFSVLALRFNPTGSLTTAPVFPENGPPSIVPNAIINVSGVWGGATTGGKGANGSGPSGLAILALNQAGPGVSGTLKFTGTNNTLASADVSGSVIAATLNFTSDHYFDTAGCGAQWGSGTSQITGVTMQGSFTLTDDVSAPCGTQSPPSTFATQFSLKLAVAEYCGTYNNPGADAGVLTLLVAADGGVVGSTTPTNGHGTGVVFSGQVTGNSLTVTNGALNILTGSIQNGAVLGTFGAGGTFAASTTGCQ